MASAVELSTLRRMTNTTSQDYGDSELEALLESYPIPDSSGRLPSESSWSARYDLNAAAADIWEWKAAALAPQIDFSDSGSFQTSQLYDHALQQARYYRSKRAASTVRLRSWPLAAETEESEISNVE